MYEAYFGLRGKPFQLNPDPSFFYGSRGHRRAMAYLEYGLHQNEGFIVVTGEVGAGKTLLVRSLLEKLDPGKIVAAKVQKVLDFGAFVELEKGVEGLVHVSEISEERVEDPRNALKAGQDVNVEVISLDPGERKIGLSIKAAQRAAEISMAQGFGGSGELGAKLGDIFKKSTKKSRKQQEQEAAEDEE